MLTLLLLALAPSALAAPPARWCWVSAGRVLALSQPDAQGRPLRPGHLDPKIGAEPHNCPAPATEGWVYLGAEDYEPPPTESAEPAEPTVEERVADHAEELRVVDAKASATDARATEQAARIETLEAEIAELRAEIERLKAGR